MCCKFPLPPNSINLVLLRATILSKAFCLSQVDPNGPKDLRIITTSHENSNGVHRSSDIAHSLCSCGSSASLLLPSCSRRMRATSAGSGVMFWLASASARSSQ